MPNLHRTARLTFSREDTMEMNLVRKIAFVVVPWLCLMLSTQAQEKPIDVTHSKITIHVGKAGLFSMAGHEHQVSAPVTQGAINESSPGHVWFRVDARTLT